MLPEEKREETQGEHTEDAFLTTPCNLRLLLGTGVHTMALGLPRLAYAFDLNYSTLTHSIQPHKPLLTPQTPPSSSNTSLLEAFAHVWYTLPTG